jgi:hypothetical protein
MSENESEKPPKKRLNFITKLIAKKQQQDKEQQHIDDRRSSARGTHLFHNKSLEAQTQSSLFNKTEFSKLLVSIIQSKDNAKRSDNKIYNFYSQHVPLNKKISVIQHFYTPQLKYDGSNKVEIKRSKSILITGLIKNKKEKQALREYVSNQRTNDKVYNSILKNILVKGYKQLPEKNNLTVSYGYTFDEKKFMKYNLITKRETNLGFILDTLKKKYVLTQNKPKQFLNFSKDSIKVPRSGSSIIAPYNTTRSSANLINPAGSSSQNSRFNSIYLRKRSESQRYSKPLSFSSYK